MVGLFFGSDTGITEEITNDIVDYFEDIDVFEICDVEKNIFDNYDKIIIGLSTWYDGDLQSDWEDYFEEFKTIDFKNKKVALYGLGDQVGYPEYFIDGVGILAQEIINNGGEVIGYWPNKEYRFTESKAVVPNQEDMFYGLAIDQDNESNLTQKRIEEWIKEVKRLFKS